MVSAESAKALISSTLEQRVNALEAEVQRLSKIHSETLTVAEVQAVRALVSQGVPTFVQFQRLVDIVRRHIAPLSQAVHQLLQVSEAVQKCNVGAKCDDQAKVEEREEMFDVVSYVKRDSPLTPKEGETKPEDDEETTEASGDRAWEHRSVESDCSSLDTGNSTDKIYIETKVGKDSTAVDESLRKVLSEVGSELSWPHSTVRTIQNKLASAGVTSIPQLMNHAANDGVKVNAKLRALGKSTLRHSTLERLFKHVYSSADACSPSRSSCRALEMPESVPESNQLVLAQPTLSSSSRCQSRSQFECATPSCRFQVHSDFLTGGAYCCFLCLSSHGETHGQYCEQCVAEPGASKAPRAWRSVPGSEVALHEEASVPSSAGSVIPARAIVAGLFKISACLVGISARVGDVVDQLNFHYSNSPVQICGGQGGDLKPRFLLGTGEYIIAVAAHMDDYLDAIQFLTNTGRVSPWYGRSHPELEGNPCEWRAPPGEQIWSMEIPTKVRKEAEVCGPIICCTYSPAFMPP